MFGSYEECLKIINDIEQELHDEVDRYLKETREQGKAWTLDAMFHGRLMQLYDVKARVSAELRAEQAEFEEAHKAEIELTDLINEEPSQLRLNIKEGKLKWK